jgi:hypothetical protein
MKNILLALVLSVFLTGCELFPTKVQVVEVKIPVATVPKPPVTVRPKLELESTSIVKDGYDGYVKALEIDMIRMRTYSSNLENIINTYKDLSEKLESVQPKENHGDPK